MKHDLFLVHGYSSVVSVLHCDCFRHKRILLHRFARHRCQPCWRTWQHISDFQHCCIVSPIGSLGLPEVIWPRGLWSQHLWRICCAICDSLPQAQRSFGQIFSLWCWWRRSPKRPVLGTDVNYVEIGNSKVKIYPGQP